MANTSLTMTMAPLKLLSAFPSNMAWRLQAIFRALLLLETILGHGWYINWRNIVLRTLTCWRIRFRLLFFKQAGFHLQLCPLVERVRSRVVFIRFQKQCQEGFNAKHPLSQGHSCVHEGICHLGGWMERAWRVLYFWTITTYLALFYVEFTTYFEGAWH